MKPFYQTLVRLTLHRRRVLVIALVLVTALLGVFAARVQVKTNFKDLLGEDRPVMQAYDALRENYPDASSIFIVLEGTSAEDLVAAGDRLASALEADNEWVQEVRWQENMGFFRRFALILEQTKALKKLRDDLASHPNLFQDAFAGYSVTNVFQGMNANFSDYDNVSRVKVDQDELVREMTYMAALLRSLTQGLEGAPDRFAIDRAMTDLLSDPSEDDLLRYVDDDGHMISPDGRVALIQVIARGDANDAIYGTNLTNHLRKLCATVAAESSSVQIGLTGFPVVLADEGQAMMNKMGLGFGIAILGILLVFFLGFRQVLLPSLAAIPLLVGVVWSVGVVSLTIGELNLFSMMAPVILLGLGIDYSIHIIAQFTQSRASGLPLEDALVDVFAKTGRGLLIGALTTAATFFAVVAAGFKGINEFGVVGGLSVLCAYAAMVLILPMLLVWADGRRTRRGKAPVHVPLPFLGNLAVSLARRRALVLAFVALLLVGGAFSLHRLTLETDVMQIEPKGLESIRLQALVLESFDFSIYATYAMLGSLDATQQAAEQLNALDTVQRTDSLATFLPSESEQEIRRDLIAEIEPALRAVQPDVDTTVDAASLDDQLTAFSQNLFQMKTLAYLGGMTRLVDRIGEVEAEIDTTRAALGGADAAAVAAVNGVVVDKMKLEYGSLIGALDNLSVTFADLPTSYADRYIGADGSYLLSIYPTGSPWVAGFADDFLGQVRTVVPQPTGIVPIWIEVLDRMVPGFIRASAVALAVLAVLLLLDLRSVRRTILILIPLLLSLFFTLALIPVLGMKLNVVNLMAFPLILGIGIDDGVHLYHRFLIDRSLRTAFSSTGKAILTTTLTTVMAMLTLGLSPHRGMVSFAWVASIGIGLCLVLNILILPGLIQTFDRRTGDDSHMQGSAE
jgi:hopanoid biosynthesis associated RND transporter like protein HpnN